MSLHVFSEVANFMGYNLAMLETWSEECGAYWECDRARDVKIVEIMYPISKDATLSRIASGLQ